MSKKRESYRPIRKPSRVGTEKGHSKKSVSIFKCGVVSHASGSAFVEQNGSKIICSVFGPRSTEGSNIGYSEEGVLRCDLRFAPFAQRESVDKDGDEEIRLARMIHDAVKSSVRLNLYPKSAIDANVVVLEKGSDVSSASVTCVSMALADAGIDMYDLVIGYHVADVKDGEDSDTSNASVTLAVMPASKRVTFFRQSGVVSPQALSGAFKTGMENCLRLRQRVRTAMEAAADKEK